jgi:hypothetical protein
VIARVEVDVAIARPPSVENITTVYVVIDGPTETECELAACQIAQSTRELVVMATGSRIVELLEI